MSAYNTARAHLLSVLSGVAYHDGVVVYTFTSADVPALPPGCYAVVTVYIRPMDSVPAYSVDMDAVAVPV